MANAAPIDPQRNSAGRGTLVGVEGRLFPGSVSTTLRRLFELKNRISADGVLAIEVGAVEKPPDDREEYEFPYECPNVGVLGDRDTQDMEPIPPPL